MNSKIFVVFTLLVLCVSFIPDSEAFTAGGGGNIPRGARREVEHIQVARELCRVARTHCKREFSAAREME
ncbi:hypothetical protein P5673_010310 [Acropora cervicornis]|uniref:Uncharacterized protein n=1 Tax=Acropora cervicornis TaxID=6130 RepID=A0AAD9QRE3_ACRCE|nr:hypothetical protein P5673_010310 [Acropora cervicornis]